ILFFFQAEDGIRDLIVTGVQTCALPIYNMPDAALDATERQFRGLLGAAADDVAMHLTLYSLPEVPRTDFGRRQVSRYSSIDDLRSEERRVGKECRSGVAAVR